MTRKEKQKAIDALKKSAPVVAVTQEEFKDYIQTLNKIMDWLEQEPCEDVISRQALLDDFGFSEKTRKWGGDHSGYNTMMLYEIQDMIESAPSANPQYTDDEIQKMQDLEQAEIQKAYELGQEDRPTGHWEWLTEDKYRCSSCNHETRVDECMNKPMYDFCPFCGAKMVEPQERRDKE